jgi:hypothetical protein
VFIFFTIVAAIAVIAAVRTIVVTARDGYGRRPKRSYARVV